MILTTPQVLRCERRTGFEGARAVEGALKPAAVSRTNNPLTPGLGAGAGARQSAP